MGITRFLPDMLAASSSVVGSSLPTILATHVRDGGGRADSPEGR